MRKSGSIPFQRFSHALENPSHLVILNAKLRHCFVQRGVQGGDPPLNGQKDNRPASRFGASSEALSHVD